MHADLATLRSRLIAFALSLPGAYEEFPWGERVVKVAKKVFVFLGKDGDVAEAGLSAKLPASRDMALSLPFAAPMEYGLGKSGWVTARFTRADAPPLELLTSWIDESYRAVAPKKLVTLLAGGAPVRSNSPTVRKKAAATRTLPKKKRAAPGGKTSTKKTSAKKTSTKKTSAKKTSAKKTSAKKTSAKKTSAKRRAVERKSPSKKAPAQREG